MPAGRRGSRPSFACATSYLSRAPPSPDSALPSQSDPERAYRLPDLIDIGESTNPDTRIEWEKARQAHSPWGLPDPSICRPSPPWRWADITARGFRFRLEATPGALESTDFDLSCSAIRQQAKHRRRRSYRTKDSSGASLIVLARGGPVDWASAVHPRGPFDHGACAAAPCQSAGSSNEFRIWHDGC